MVEQYQYVPVTGMDDSNWQVFLLPSEEMYKWPSLINEIEQDQFLEPRDAINLMI